MYQLKTTKKFDKKLSKLDRKLQQTIITKINELASDPYDPNNNVTKLKKDENAYRLRVGDWRIIYELHDYELVMLVLEVESRGDVYK